MLEEGGQFRQRQVYDRWGLHFLYVYMEIPKDIRVWKIVKVLYVFVSRPLVV